MNQLVEATDGTVWTYDSMGNMIGKEDEAFEWEYVYSPENRLLRVEKNGDAQGIYSYDFQGRRVTSLEPGADTLQFAWDDWNTVADYAGDDDLMVTYLTGLGLDQLILQENPAGVQKWFLQDRVNSVVGITDSAGEIAGWKTYEAFGAVRASSGMNGVRMAFTGREIGREDLVYFRIRWYTDILGRFLSPDPLSLSMGYENLYRYGDNCPALRNDPLGLQAGEFVCKCLELLHEIICYCEEVTQPFPGEDYQYCKDGTLYSVRGGLVYSYPNDPACAKAKNR